MGEEKQVMLLALDAGEHSLYALEWTLDHFFSNNTPCKNVKLIIIHAKANAASHVGLAGPGSSDLVPIVEADMKIIADSLAAKANEACKKRSLENPQFVVLEGDARKVLVDSVEKYHASFLILGSHGYGAFQRAILGSVSDYCVHHAQCTVMIVKKPKHKH